MEKVDDVFSIDELADYLKIPKSIIEKPPSADLWPGHTDEDELGLTYARADLVLHRLYDVGQTAGDLLAEGFEPRVVRRVIRLVNANQFKSQLPEIARLEN